MGFSVIKTWDTPMDVEIAASIAKHTIVSFVRHYMKDFKVNPIKDATLSKHIQQMKCSVHLTRSDEDMTLAVPTPSATTSDTSNTNIDMQLFTPTTKKVLEEIGQSLDY
ncbi:hypothetical protein ACH5RR_040483 [Cinchona calisaya]|uniref:Uncharacterized protein n=1 Tax=Cinchona calisaya TaxID=153742 RepID=A0ABD2XRW5_9GENT